jgi:magnesium-transporting ATPase (P-type)
VAAGATAEMVPGEVVKLSLDTVVAADVRLTAGEDAASR